MSTGLHKLATIALIVILLASTLAGTRPVQATGVTPPKKLRTPQEVLQRVKSQVIVRFKDGVSAERARRIIGATGGTVKKSLTVNNTKSGFRSLG